MKQFCVISLAFLAFACVTQAVELECLDSKDCGPGKYCQLSMQPNSFPTCVPARSEGDSCRVGNSPTDTTVTYPNGQQFHLTNIFYSVCPCASGLSCERGVCSA